jgi:uncharacterized membrane protein
MSAIELVAPKLVLPGKSLPAGEGTTWIGRGWELFKKAPLMWIVCVVILFVVSIVLSVAGFVGTIIYYLVSPVLAAGLAKGCLSLEQGGELEFEHLFAGFTGPRLVPLLILGAIFIAAYGVLILVFVMFAGMSVLSAFMVGDPSAIYTMGAAVLMPILLGTLVVAALAVPVMAAYWFAPTLVMLNDLTPLDAAKESFRACMRNFLSFLVYGIVMLLLAIVAMIPLGLGLLVWVPLLIASTYTSYRQIFTEETTPSVTPAFAG